ncbi:hypothetical protein ABIF86_007178 [Bradyrhizobium japonicum]
MSATRLAAAIAVVCLSSCTVVPHSTGPANVRFDQVVKRVKCDLVGAVYRKAYEDWQRYGFLTQWAAKVHMTLTVDDQASVNPGLTITDPLAVAGTSFSFGLGGTYTGQAQRIEDYEFFLSFAIAGPEMTRDVVERFYDGCQFADGQLLESNFDFDSVIARAVSPIKAGLLKQGRQTGPGSSTSPQIPSNEIPNIKQALQAAADSPIVKPDPKTFAGTNPQFKLIFEHIQNQFNIARVPDNPQKLQKDQDAEDAATAIANSPKVAQNVHDVIENVVKPLYDLAITTDLPKKCNLQMQRDRASALSSAAEAAIAKSNIDNAKPEDFKLVISSFAAQLTARSVVLAKSQAMLTDITGCKEPPTKPAKPAVALYDPIDLIQETANFYITASGSVAPSWKLVRISAPLGSPLFSATAKTTDSMIVTMGRPNIENGRQVPSKSMENSLQASLISQAINSRLVP